MAESIEVYDKTDFILATYLGPFSVNGAQEAINRVLRSISGEGPRPVLIDCTEMTGNLSVVDRFQTVLYGRKMKGRVSKLAIVRPRERRNADRFVETAAQNRGISVRLFADIEDAIAWLKE